tara:strand:+ start:203 stop:646 length:444 start_codon:yes stop_codon:yes gene_type:complete
MRIEIDISGNMKFLYKDSVMAFATEDGKVYNTVFLDKRLKRKIFTKYSSRIKNVKEQLHCIMIYYCIRDYIDKIKEMKICPDISPFKMNQYLRVYLPKDSFGKIKKKIVPVGHDCFVHKIAYRTYKRKIEPKLILTKEMITKLLLKE